MSPPRDQIASLGGTQAPYKEDTLSTHSEQTQHSNGGGGHQYLHPLLCERHTTVCLQAKLAPTND